MAIYKSLVGGKVFTTNNKGVIEVLTAKELKEEMQKVWWRRVIKKYFS